MSVADVDYNELAEYAKRSPLSWDTICERAEAGVPLPKLPDDTWLATREAAEYCSVSYESFCGLVIGSRLRAQSRSAVKADARRGCGMLYHIEDLDEVKRIRAVCSFTFRHALAVFNARADGLL